MSRNDEIEVFGWHEAVRRRPEMYVGDTGRLGQRYLARALFECPLSPRRLQVTVDQARLEIVAASAPVSVKPREAGKPMYLLEIAGSFKVPIDHPPSIAMLEVLDTETNPARFVRVPEAPSIVGIATALSAEMRLISREAGVATEARFSRGVLVSPPAAAPTASGDGLTIGLVLDAAIFPQPTFAFTDLAEELRDFALRRRVEVELRDVARDLLYRMTP